MSNFNYKNMTPFKWFVLENFPFIENDFEAINNYRLFSKVVEYLNKTIDNVNVLGQLVESFSDYFDNLDVQEEINNKLDEMATDGTLENIINQEIFSQINNDINNLKNNVNDLYALDRNTDLRTICIGDSYLRGSSNGSVVNSWGYYVKQYLNISSINYEEYFESSSSILNHGVNGNTFLQLIQAQTISNPETVKRVIVAGGYNDKDYTKANIETGVQTLINYLKTTFVNAKIYFGCIGNHSGIGSSQATIRRNIAREVLPAYKNCELYGATYLNGVEDITHDYVFCYNLDDDGDTIHPTQNGYLLIGRGIAEAIKTGNANYCSPDFDTKEMTPLRTNVTGTIPSITTYIKNGIKTIMFSNINMSFDRSNLNSGADPGASVTLCDIPKNSNIRCVFDLLNNTQFKLNVTNADVEGETTDVIGSLCVRAATGRELLQLRAIVTPSSFPTNNFKSIQTTWSFPAFVS